MNVGNNSVYSMNIYSQIISDTESSDFVCINNTILSDAVGLIRRDIMSKIMRYYLPKIIYQKFLKTIMLHVEYVNIENILLRCVYTEISSRISCFAKRTNECAYMHTYIYAYICIVFTVNIFMSTNKIA